MSKSNDQLVTVREAQDGAPGFKIPAPPKAPEFSSVTDKTAFETVTCGRCGGSGHYSFNQINGTTCFGCARRGWKFTKRGAMAFDKYTELLSKRADQFQVGELIQSDGRFYRINEVKIAPQKELGCYSVGRENEIGVRIDAGKEGRDARGQWQGVRIHCAPDEIRRFGATLEQKQAAQKAALAYQATLTKTGKPRK